MKIIKYLINVSLLFLITSGNAAVAMDEVSGYTEISYSSNLKSKWRYKELKTLIARTIDVCSSKKTNGTTNNDLLEITKQNRYKLIELTMKALVDPIGSNSRTIMIEPSILGRHKFPTWIDGHVVKFKFDQNKIMLSIASWASEKSYKSYYMALYDYNQSSKAEKSCGFSYRR